MRRSQREVLLRVCARFEFRENQVNCLKECGSHPNIVQLQDTFSYQHLVCQIYEKLDGGSVLSLIHSEKKISESEGRVIFTQLTSALVFLHSKKWAHGDVKPDNLIFNRETQTLKLVGFEGCCRTSRWSRSRASNGTLQYASPEVRRGKYCSPESDVWSLGVTLYVMIIGYYPFSNEELLAHSEVFGRPSKDEVSNECSDLIARMLEKKRKRITTEQISQHSWLCS